MFDRSTADFIQLSYNMLWSKYFNQYGVKEKWKILKLNIMASALNFVDQLIENGKDFEIIFSAYIWCLITARNPSNSLPRNQNTTIDE